MSVCCFLGCLLALFSFLVKLKFTLFFFKLTVIGPLLKLKGLCNWLTFFPKSYYSYCIWYDMIWKLNIYHWIPIPCRLKTTSWRILQLKNLKLLNLPHWLQQIEFLLYVSICSLKVKHYHLQFTLVFIFSFLLWPSMA